MFAAETKAGVLPITSSLPTRLSPAWEDIVEPVQPFLDQVAEGLAQQVSAFDSEVAPYAQYALTNQGKQLRPVLVALSAGATGRMNESLVTVAVIIEMVHLATLVHDDVMDEAEIRRRRPTLAANWGNELSVLVGDCLFAHAVSLAASFPTPEVCRAVASATNTVCSGEILQTQQRRNLDFARSDYFKVLEMKTAELFALSCHLGAKLAGSSEAGCSALRRFGLALGTAYQVYDDCLDLFGSEIKVGKSLGTDLANGKLTLPLLVVLEQATPAERDELRDYIGSWHASRLPAVLNLLDKYCAYQESRDVVQRFLDQARLALAGVAPSASRAGLTGLTHFLAKQTDALGVNS
jgi:octaprenyl-diphosphate synthase